jgi:hypothetical protein
MRPEPPIPADLWEPIPPTAQAAVRALVQAYEQRLAVLQQRLEDLEQRLGQNATNSSQPPLVEARTARCRAENLFKAAFAGPGDYFRLARGDRRVVRRSLLGRGGGHATPSRVHGPRALSSSQARLH